MLLLAFLFPAAEFLADTRNSNDRDDDGYRQRERCSKRFAIIIAFNSRDSPRPTIVICCGGRFLNRSWVLEPSARAEVQAPQLAKKQSQGWSRASSL